MIPLPLKEVFGASVSALDRMVQAREIALCEGKSLIAVGLPLQPTIGEALPRDFASRSRLAILA
jgi:hypothetical protein